MTVLTFLGTGTSQGVPVISCKCHVCQSGDPRDSRLRSSVMLDNGDIRIIIDAGPDFRQQMLRAKVDCIDGILVTHEHKDHIAGIDDVRAFNYTSRKAVKIYATPQVQKTIVKDFDYAFEEDKYPGVPEIDLIDIDGITPFRIKNTEIIPVSGKHYKLPILGFRIGDIAYLTDFNHIDDSEKEKLKGLDILVVNALRKEHHISHFTLDEAVALSRELKPRRTYFTHVSHQMGFCSEVQPQLPEGMYLAYDGLKVESNL